MNKFNIGFFQNRQIWYFPERQGIHGTWMWNTTRGRLINPYPHKTRYPFDFPKNFGVTYAR